MNSAEVKTKARVPLASGLLTGKFTAESIATTNFTEGDHRRFNRGGECFDAGETYIRIPAVNSFKYSLRFILLR